MIYMLDTANVQSKVLAASFKNVDQIYRVYMSGTDAITITPGYGFMVFRRL